MRTVVLLIVSLMIVGGLRLDGQTETVAGSTVPGREYTLSPLKPPKDQKATDLKCGQYFAGMRDEPPRHSLINFQFDDKTFDGRSAQIATSVMFMRSDKFVTVIDNRKSVPTVVFTDQRGTSKTPPFYWTVRISRKEFETAKACLPTPR